MNSRSHRLTASGIALIASGLFAACKADMKPIGTLPAETRPAPLSPATRAELESRGAVCTPNPNGPVFCTWTSPSGDVTCRLTFDDRDQLTHLTCILDGLTWACTRPGDLFACTWSDAPDCADVYSLRGSFEAYLCGQDLQDRIRMSRPDAGIRLDGGIFRDGGGPLDFGVRDVGRPGPDSGMVDRDSGVMRRDGGNAPDSGVDVCAALAENDCQTSRSCHAVYLPSDVCGCSAVGCCVLFDHCAPNRQADCSSASLACRRLPPQCGSRFVLSYVDNCYEGCVYPAECAQTSEVQCSAMASRFPMFDKSCRAASECHPAIHQVDCCGTRAAIGITLAEVRHFNDDEGICRAQFPACGCPQQPTSAEDGQRTDDESTIAVDCVRGQCRTFIP